MAIKAQASTRTTPVTPSIPAALIAEATAIGRLEARIAALEPAFAEYSRRSGNLDSDDLDDLADETFRPVLDAIFSDEMQPSSKRDALAGVDFVIRELEELMLEERASGLLKKCAAVLRGG